jgi:hypothetical protein
MTTNEAIALMSEDHFLSLAAKLDEEMEAIGGDPSAKVTLTRARLKHLRRIDQLALDFHNRILDVEGLRWALAVEYVEPFRPGEE